MEQIELRALKSGEYFTLTEIEEPKESQVWIKGAYDRSTKTFGCSRFSDVCNERFFKASRMVYVGFTF